MNTREYASGNYYQDEKGNIEKLDTFEINYGVLEYPLYLKPIPLTEEWLVKFGFIFTDYCIENHPIQLQTLSENRGFLFQYDFVKYSGYGSTFNVVIQYVHQLQNLYWCICGEELPINHPSDK
jgi:hypothetical protein